MQIRMENARFGHVPLVKKAFGIDSGWQQPKSFDATEWFSLIADGPSLQKQPISLG